MAQSTAEEIALLLPNVRRTKTKGLMPLLWRRNRGYFNRKATSFLFDVLEILSVALLTDIGSLKYLYIIWVIFYFSQNILESLFYTARKIFVYEKEFPVKRTLAYVHILVLTIPFFFLMVSFEKFSQNNIAITYLSFKAIILIFQTVVNYINFEVQTLSRIYYPPSLNWILVVVSATLIVLAQNIFDSFISFFATLTVLLMVRIVQDTIILRRAKELKSSILWQLKRNRLTNVNTILEFMTLMSIEIFLPLSILSLPHQIINVQNMSLIFLIYMIVKIFMRPIRSLILDLWTIGRKMHKKLIIGTSLLAFSTSIFLLLLYPSFQSAICIGLIYFYFLVLWNTKLTDNKIILVLNISTFVLLAFGKSTFLLMAIITLIFIFCFFKKFKQPRNLVLNRRFQSFENKYVISFKRIPHWSKMAKKYPELKWSPVRKKICVVESLNFLDTDIQNFIMKHSYELRLVEKMDLALAKKLNIL